MFEQICFWIVATFFFAVGAIFIGAILTAIGIRILWGLIEAYNRYRRWRGLEPIKNHSWYYEWLRECTRRKKEAARERSGAHADEVAGAEMERRAARRQPRDSMPDVDDEECDHLAALMAD